MLDIFKKSYENVQPQQVKKMMNDKDVQEIDVRESYEFARRPYQIGKVNASWIPSDKRGIS